MVIILLSILARVAITIDAVIIYGIKQKCKIIWHAKAKYSFTWKCFQSILIVIKSLPLGIIAMTKHHLNEAFDATYLRSILVFYPQIDVWCWKVSIGGNRAGDVAGCEHERREYKRKPQWGIGGTWIHSSRRAAEDKYWLIRINGHQYNSKLLAYLYLNGEWPYSLASLKRRSADAKEAERYKRSQQEKSVYWDLDKYCWTFDGQSFGSEAEAKAARLASLSEDEMQYEVEMRKRLDRFWEEAKRK
jgi:hypothetical protein